MDVKSLLHLGCAKVASLIKGDFFADKTCFFADKTRFYIDV